MDSGNTRAATESRTFEEGKQYDNNNNPRWLFTFHSQCAVITPLFYATLLLEMPSSIGCKYYVHEEPIKGTVQIIYICNTNSSKYFPDLTSSLLLPRQSYPDSPFQPQCLCQCYQHNDKFSSVIILDFQFSGDKSALYSPFH